MVNKFKVLPVILLVVFSGIIIDSLTVIPEGYAAIQNPSNFKQVLLQFKDKSVSIKQIDPETDKGEWWIDGKLLNVGDDFIEVARPNRYLSDNFSTYYIPFTSIIRIEKSKDGDLKIFIR